MEDIAKKQRQDIEDLLKSKGMRRGTYPNFTVSVKGQKVSEMLQPYMSGCFCLNVLRPAHAFVSHVLFLSLSKRPGTVGSKRKFFLLSRGCNFGNLRILRSGFFLNFKGDIINRRK